MQEELGIEAMFAVQALRSGEAANSVTIDYDEFVITVERKA